MRHRVEVEDRIHAILLDAFQARLRQAEQRIPKHCVHNHAQPLDLQRHLPTGEANEGYNRLDRRHLPQIPTIGICMYKADPAWQGTICDEPSDAQGCGFFTPNRTPDQVISEFEADFADPDWVDQHYPGLATLRWVLEQGPVEVQLPWWLRIWHKLTRFRVRPVVKSLPAVESTDHGLPSTREDPGSGPASHSSCSSRESHTVDG